MGRKSMNAAAALILAALLAGGVTVSFHPEGVRHTDGGGGKHSGDYSSKKKIAAAHPGAQFDDTLR